MREPVQLLVPTDPRFLPICSDLARKYGTARGASESEAAELVKAVTEAVGAVTEGVPPTASLQLDLDGADGTGPVSRIQVRLSCGDRSSVVSQALAAGSAT
jgi:hypothetical protein